MFNKKNKNSFGKDYDSVLKRRVILFKQNKRGYYSFILFMLLFSITLFAEFIANDKPVFIMFEKKMYFPVLKEYSEAEFGGEFLTEADYRDSYVQGLINEKGFMIWPVIRFSYDTINFNLKSPAPSRPTRENLLGTDDQGRDVLARLIYGFRISVLFGLCLSVLGSLIGIAVGGLQGYFGGKIDLFGQRIIEIWSGMPVLYLLIILSGFIQPGFFWLLFIMLLFSWMSLVDVVRAEFLRCRNMEYILAAKAMGVSSFRIMTKHMLPNAMIAVMTFFPFVLNSSITTLTSLDFLGFGMPVGSPSLGELLAQGKENLQAPWLGISAFITLSFMLSILIFTGEAVRDAFDPRIEG